LLRPQTGKNCNFGTKLQAEYAQKLKEEILVGLRYWGKTGYGLLFVS